MRSVGFCVVALALGASSARAWQAVVVPNEIQQPGTQPLEVGPLDPPSFCDNCHGGYDEAVEPAFTWRGGMMSQATRDPIFWATVAVAEQDFSGSGDLCLRCHTPNGWIAGHSTPTDGSGFDRIRVIATTGEPPAFPPGAKNGRFTFYATEQDREQVASAVRGIVLKKAGTDTPAPAGAVAYTELRLRIQK